ncbi:MAG: GntP family permease [Bryobacterales bacterium]|nr:GntP family permease [Bryobacterales bacterium]
MHPLGILLVSIVAVLFLIIRMKINAFLALIGVAILIGLLSPEIAITDVMKQVGDRFGNVVGRIGIVILTAAIVGQCLMESGAADRITRVFVRAIGERRASLSMTVTGFVLSIPVFADTVFYLLIPLARAMCVRMGGRDYMLLTMAISAGASSTHAFVPPTPGPLAGAAILGVDVGLTILVGIGIAAVASTTGWLYAAWANRTMPIEIRETPGVPVSELREIAAKPDSELPGFWLSMSPILLPVLLISVNTAAGTLAKGSTFARWMTFFGDASFALLLAAVISVWILARQKSLSLAALARPIEEAMNSAGMIILITAGGGAFGGMLEAAGVGKSLGAIAQQFGVSLVVLAFVVAVLFKIAQGSGTVAMITGSSITAALAAATPPTCHPVYLVMAVACGSMTGSWMNDSGFWVYRSMTGLTEMETLKTRSVLMSVMGVSGFLVTLAASVLVPLR